MFMYKISTREFVEMVISTPPPPDVLQTLLVAHLFRRYHGKGLLITQRVSLPFSRST